MLHKIGQGRKHVGVFFPDTTGEKNGRRLCDENGVCVARITEYLDSILNAGESGRMWKAKHMKCQCKIKVIKNKNVKRKLRKSHERVLDTIGRKVSEVTAAMLRRKK